MRKLEISLIGASHEEYVGCIVRNMPKGLEINKEFINNDLLRRRPKGKSNSPRVELDEYIFESGVTDNKTDGNDLIIKVFNKNYNSKEYNNIVRPNHVDLEKYLKYNGNVNLAGGGNSSGRMTVSLVILGSIISKYLLDRFNIKSNSIIRFLGDKQINKESIDENDIKELDLNDSYGGMITTSISNMVRGLGESYNKSVKSEISSLLFMIPSVCGVSFGDIDLFLNKGSNVLDEPFIINNEFKYKSNHLGGIVGGITNGNDLVINTSFKPIPSIKKEVSTIDLNNMTNIKYTFNNRSDSEIISRVSVVLESMIKIGLFDIMLDEGKIL